MLRARSLLLLALAGCCPPGATATQTTPTPPDTEGIAPPVEVTPPAAAAEQKLDGGTLAIAVNGVAAGTEGFEVRRRGDVVVLENHIDATVLGQTIRGRGEMVYDDRGRTVRGVLTTSVNGVAVATAIAGGPDAMVATVKAGDTAAKEQRATGPVDLYLDNASFAHLAGLCSSDAPRVMVFPGTPMTRGAVREAGGARVVAYAIASTVAFEVYCDAMRFLGADVPGAGITVTRTGEEERVAALRKKPREKPALPAGLVEHDRSVDVPAAPGVEAARLACTLLVPASRTKKLPGVIFITGSGVQDRDEDSYGPGGIKLSIFKTMAIELGKAGIASLRCDDRGGGGSTGDATTATLATFTADAAAMLAALRRDPAVNPAKTGMIGHSEGGTVAPLAALAVKPAPRALVLMAGVGRPFDVLLDEQAMRAMAQSGTPDAVVAAELAKRKAVYDAMRAGTPLPATLDPAEARIWEATRPWLTSHLKHDPAVTAGKVKGVAVFVAQGQLDQQVAVADADALAAALQKRNKVVEKKIYPGLNHLFAPTKTGDISEYADPDVSIDPTFLADVVRFLTKHL